LITGPGALRQIGSGATYLTADNTFTGGTTISAGTLEAGTSSAMGSGTVTQSGGTLLLDNAVNISNAMSIKSASFIDVDGNNAATISGQLYGSAPFEKDGTGTLILTDTNNVNSYSGNISFHGRLTCGNGSCGSGTLIFLGTVFALHNGFIVDNALVLADNSEVDVDSGTALITGNISQTNGAWGLTKLGIGTLDLTGTESYSGPTEIAAGTLDVNGTITGALLIDKGATLTGVGKMLGPVTNYGTIAPGDDPGTLTFGAPLTLAGGALQIDIDGTGTGSGAGAYSRLIVAGPGATLTAGGLIDPVLRGITGNATNTYTPPVGQAFDFAHADGGVIGSFAGITQPTAGLLAGTQFDAIYGATDVMLVVTPVSYTNLAPIGIADTANRRSLGAAIDSYRLAPGLIMSGDRNAVLSNLYLLAAPSIAPAMDQIAGTVHGDAMSMAAHMDQLVEDTTNSRLSDIDGARPGAAVVPTTALSDDATLWMSANGGWQVTGTDGNAPGYRDYNQGLAVGVDFASAANARMGASFSYETGHVSTDNAAEAKVTAQRLSLYGATAIGALRLNGEVAESTLRFSTQRQVHFGAINRVADGSARASQLSMDVSAHYHFGKIEPFVEWTKGSISRNGFGEANAGDLSLHVFPTVFASSKSSAGVDIDASDLLRSASQKGLLSFRLSWDHDFDAVESRTDAAMLGAPGTPFSVDSSRFGADAAVAKMRLNIPINAVFNVFGDVHAEMRERQSSQSVTVGVSGRW
jgi:subtilase-type serine protease